LQIAVATAGYTTIVPYTMCEELARTYRFERPSGCISPYLMWIHLLTRTVALTTLSLAPFNVIMTAYLYGTGHGYTRQVYLLLIFLIHANSFTALLSCLVAVQTLARGYADGYLPSTTAGMLHGLWIIFSGYFEPFKSDWRAVFYVLNPFYYSIPTMCRIALDGLRTRECDEEAGDYLKCTFESDGATLLRSTGMADLNVAARFGVSFGIAIGGWVATLLMMCLEARDTPLCARWPRVLARRPGGGTPSPQPADPIGATSAVAPSPHGIDNELVGLADISMLEHEHAFEAAGPYVGGADYGLFSASSPLESDDSRTVLSMSEPTPHSYDVAESSVSSEASIRNAGSIYSRQLLTFERSARQQRREAAEFSIRQRAFRVSSEPSLEPSTSPLRGQDPSSRKPSLEPSTTAGGVREVALS